MPLFTGYIADFSLRDNRYFLKDVQGPDGLAREHAWVEAMPGLPWHVQLKIEGEIRHYTKKDGSSNWTIAAERAEVLT